MANMVNLTIDNKKVEVPEGLTLIEAAELNGTHIPNLCYLKGTRGIGACRLCLVEIEGTKSPMLGCTTKVKEGMVINTKTEKVEEVRKFVIDLILSMHPLDCMTCTKAGVCALQQYAYDFGIKESSFTRKKFGYAIDEANPFIKRDPDYCILCGRCVRVCEEIRGVGAIAFTKRGHGTKVGTSFGISHLDGGCQFCGACVDVCPTGALSARATKWHGKPEKKARTACTLCGVGCAIELQGRWDRVMDAIPHMDGPTNQGQGCVLGRFCIPPLFNSKDRLKYPLVRKEGSLVPVDWDEAIAEAAKGLKRYEPGDVDILVSPNVTNETARMLHRLSKDILGGARIELDSQFDSLALAASRSLTGCAGSTGELSAIDRADAVLVVGADICLTHPVLRVRLNRARARGAKIIWLGPTRDPNDRLVDILVPEANYLEVLAGTLKRLASSAKEGFDALSGSLDGFTGFKGAADISEALRGKRAVALVGRGIMPHRPKATLTALWDILVSTENTSGLLLLIEGNSQGICDAGIVGENDVRRDAKALYVTSSRAEMPEGAEFVVLQAPFSSKLVERADVVFPSLGLPEESGTTTSMDGHVQEVRPVSKGPGMALADAEIVSRLVAGLGGKKLDMTTAQLGPRPVRQPLSRLYPLGVLGPEPSASPAPASPNFYRGTDIAEKVADLTVYYRYRGVIP